MGEPAGSGAVRGLDHVAVVSARTEALFAAYEGLGFRLTSTSRHRGSPAPGEPVVPWGTGNRCAMFRSGYLELLAIFEPAMHCGPFPDLVAVYEGLHIVAMECGDAAAARARLDGAGLPVAGLVDLERSLEGPDGTDALARFRLVRFAAGALPEARFNVIEHLTRPLLWQERHLEHPNRAVSLDEVLVAVADPDEAEARYRRLFGRPAERRGPARRFSLEAGAFTLAAAADMPSLVPGAAAPAVPSVVAFAVGTADQDAARRHLADAGVDAAEHDRRLVVPASAGCGAVCVFAPAGNCGLLP